ncbi:MAG: TIGR03756 family integrating conjugative element protein [Tatlockia sp.]|nr:TIGR03756 family integrating conjugative element protein [Tatlockia sp.]
MKTKQAIATNKGLVFFLSVALSGPLAADMESTKPPHPLNTFTLAKRVVEKTFENSKYKIIGACTWLSKGLLKPTEGLAVEQFVPDLVVTVSNNPGENPWVEAGGLFENAVVMAGYQKVFESAMGMPFDYGGASVQVYGPHLNDDISRVVHVIGSPPSLFQLQEVTHKPETTFGKPYYSSHADAVSDRMETGELAYMATHPQLLINHEIGTNTHSWGPEFPRLMRVTQPSRFRASVVAAMHAADIVTNKKSLHIRQGTSNVCGPNCVIANVIFDPEEEKVIWQEVYPENRNIKPGNPDDFGEADDIKGNGNYVFVIWRKYRGCIQQKGTLLLSTPPVGEPQKR